MNITIKKILKFTLTSIFLITFLTSCSSHKNISDAKGVNFLLDTVKGSNDFESLIETLVIKSEEKLKKHLYTNEAILVSDFVNIKNYKNTSKLGFLLSEQLKNSLLDRDIIVKQVELGKQFQFGPTGFNLLTRNQADIANKHIDNNFALVGTYTLTTKNLIVFLKLIDISTGNILSSSNVKTSIDKEILELEKRPKSLSIYSPMTL